MKRVLLMVMAALVLGVGLMWGWTVYEGSYTAGAAAYAQGDYAKALKIFRPLATQGHVEAQSSLGVMYYEGKGVAQDYSEAVKWSLSAAAQGNVRAQNKLSLMYFNGQGVAQNFVRAHMWSSLAAVSGDAEAVKFRDMISKLMSQQQVAQANKMMSECQQLNFKGCD